MRRRCQRNSVSAVTSHPARLGRGSAAALAPSKLRSASVNSGRSTCRRSTPSWWPKTMISRSLQRPERTVSRASDARNRYKIPYTTNQHRPASRQVNDHGRVSGTHRVSWHQDAPSWPLTRHRVVTLAPEIGSSRIDMQHHFFGRRADSQGTRDLSRTQVAEAAWGIGR